MSEALGFALIGASGGILAGLATLLGVRSSRRAGVAADEREARRDEAAQKRDTIADRDGLIDQLQEDVKSLREGRQHDLEQRERLETRMASVERELFLERAWNRTLIDQIYRGEPPPPRPRPTE